jgi:hypothetical protein
MLAGGGGWACAYLKGTRQTAAGEEEEAAGPSHALEVEVEAEVGAEAVAAVAIVGEGDGISDLGRGGEACPSELVVVCSPGSTAASCLLFLFAAGGFDLDLLYICKFWIFGLAVFACCVGLAHWRRRKLSGGIRFDHGSVASYRFDSWLTKSVAAGTAGKYMLLLTMWPWVRQWSSTGCVMPICFAGFKMQEQ